MKIAIVGAGAMGSVYGAILSRAGNTVWLIDRWRDHVDSIRRDGLRVSGASGDYTVCPSATTNAEEAGVSELVVIATKAPDVRAALTEAAPLIGPDTTVLTIQNGLGSAEAVADRHDSAKVLVGVAGGFGASIPGPGEVHHNGWELVRIGPLRSGSIELARRIVHVWTDAGFHAEAAPDVDVMVWSKLVCNAAYSAICCVTGLTIGGVRDNLEAWGLASACAQEAFAVARAKGLDLGFTDPAEHVWVFGGRIPAARPSLLLDRLAGRQGEIDSINGAIVDAARHVDVPAPTNATLTSVVRAMELSDIRPRFGEPVRAEGLL